MNRTPQSTRSGIHMAMIGYLADLCGVQKACFSRVKSKSTNPTGGMKAGELSQPLASRSGHHSKVSYVDFTCQVLQGSQGGCQCNYMRSENPEMKKHES